MRKVISLEQRFLEKVKVSTDTECWEWLAHKDRDGYGKFTSPVGAYAHRYAYFATHGVCPNICRHTCDNPSCVNPSHLLDGTLADNIRDRDSRGRGIRGTKQHKAKLTEKDVIEIRYLLSLKNSQASIAELFKVSQSVVCEINTGRTWKHI